MRDGVSLADDRMRLVGESAAIVKGTLDEWVMPLTKTVDVFP